MMSEKPNPRRNAAGLPFCSGEACALFRAPDDATECIAVWPTRSAELPTWRNAPEPDDPAQLCPPQVALDYADTHRSRAAENDGLAAALEELSQHHEVDDEELRECADCECTGFESSPSI